MKFSKVDPGFRRKDYSAFREYTRHDFRQVCAYCFRHEEDAGGDEHFEQDHFEPQSRVGVNPADYFNLYWSCRGCNGRANKGDAWPSVQEQKSGRYFCDPCLYDPWSRDYRLKPDGELEPITEAGDYTIETIRLNRPVLARWRKSVKEIRKEYLNTLNLLYELRANLERGLAATLDPTKASLLAIVKDLIVEHRKVAYAKPFIRALSLPLPPIPNDVMRLLVTLRP